MLGTSTLVGHRSFAGGLIHIFVPEKCAPLVILPGLSCNFLLILLLISPIFEEEHHLGQELGLFILEVGAT